MTGFVDFQSDPEAIWEHLTTVSGTLAYDIGANGGLVARSLAERFETVIAVEPAHESYPHLVGSVPPNVKPLNIAVSDLTGTVTLRETSLTESMGELFTDDTLPWGVHVGYRELACITLDDLAFDYGFPDFIKIDTEGHELKIVQGGAQVFLRDPAFVIEVHADWKGQQIMGYFDVLEVPYERSYHQSYRLQSPNRFNHYWLTSPPERLR